MSGNSGGTDGALGRRRFLLLGGTAALLATGCARLLGEPSTAPGEQPGPRAGGEPRTDAAAPSGPDAAATSDGAEPDIAGRDNAERDDAQPDDTLPDTTDDPAASAEADPGPDPESEPDPEADPAPPATDRAPTEWGERVTGVRTRIATDERLVALTFDGCGGPNGNGVDTALLDHLADLAVPATLFLNARWIQANRSLTRELAREPRYELANHGTEHRPLSVTGRQAYGIRGTRSPDEVVSEVMTCQRLIEEVTGQRPRHFRSGTAYADEVAVEIVQGLGLEVVNFDVLGDAGATFSAAQVERALLSAGPGSIALLHLNRPGSGTAAGVAAAVPQLRDRGFSFTTLGDHRLV